MLDRILPALYRRLRESTQLSQEQFASLLGVTRDTLRRYESGKNRPDLETERKLVEASGCSDLELVEMLCEISSEELGMRVGITGGEDGYRPGTSLARAEEVRRRYGGEMDESELRTLNNKMHTAQLMRMTYERLNGDLDEYVGDCLAKAERRRATAAPTQGATGPATEGSSGGARPVFHIAGTGRRTGND